MKHDPRVVASASEALQAAGSKGWGSGLQDLVQVLRRDRLLGIRA
jgi:hypothetical protein